MVRLGDRHAHALEIGLDSTFPMRFESLASFLRQAKHDDNKLKVQELARLHGVREEEPGAGLR
eukprot:CAMPEP_0113667154 /NCGR_PEP_ID=MMETSP0038_2-20120614/3279_1 /TAXON_ID=2898 /ORGANISM="Cryptomonas paramecium" /LENGTH=62 /DNA_ID=CAMNT_0000582739 /DNA_START=489 /DNA_END=673 /DNA_ORIENTATION=- /assembly_acc=CAM_ASM_000170